MKRFVLGLVLPVLLAMAPPVMAQTGSQCAAIDTDVERLACYDALFRDGGEKPAADAVVLQSEQLIPAHPSGRAPATVTISCAANGLQVAFGFAGNRLSSLGRDIGVTLQYDLQRRSSTLPVDASNTAILIDNTRDALAFLDALAGVTNLTVRVTPVTTRTLSVRFQVEDVAARVAPVVEACAAS